MRIGFRALLRTACGLALGLVLAAGSGGAASAQSGLFAEGLDLWLAEAEGRAEFEELIAAARDVQGMVEGDIAELQRIGSATDGLLLRDATGGFVSVAHDDAASLGRLLLLDLFLTAGENIPPVVRGGSDIFEAISMWDMMIALWDGNPADMSVLDAGRTLLLDAFTSALVVFDERNRDALNSDIRDLNDQLANIATLIELAEARLREASAPRPGILNAAGYYVVQFSGEGWRKKGFPNSQLITGYQNRLIKVTDAVTERSYRSVGWLVPRGTDIRDIQRDREEIAREGSIKACERGRPACPCKPPPDIWSSGPVYEVVDGPFASIAEARVLMGNPREKNLDPASSKQWNYQNIDGYDRLIAACRALGADMD